jgi:hypothetical protein
MIGWRRAATWTALGLLLTTIGAVLYVILPPAPRWTVTGKMRQFIANDGPVIAGDLPALATYNQRGDVDVCGPVQVWDAATGQEIAQFLGGESHFLAHGQSRDGCRIVALLPGAGLDKQRIAWVDLGECRSWQVDAALGQFDAALFSRDCSHIALWRQKIGERQADFALAEAGTGRVLTRFVVPCRAARSEIRQWPNTPDYGMFTEDGRYFALNRSDGRASEMHIVETQLGKHTMVANAEFLAAVPGSRLLIGSYDGTAWIWDLAAMDWRAPLEAAAPGTLRFSADGRWMASVPPRQKEPVAVRFFDLATGRLHWELRSITASSEEMQEEAFSPDGRFFVLPTEPVPGQRSVAMFDVAAKRKVWEQIWPANFGVCLFTADSRTLINARAAQVEAIDVATGEPRFTIDLPQSVALDPWLSRDGKRLYIERQPAPPEPTLWNELLEDYWPWPPDADRRAPMPFHAFDMATGRELWCLETMAADQLWIGNDRVVTLNVLNDAGQPAESTMQRWDLPPRKRLEWIAGMPACVGALLLIAGAGWRRWRRHRAALVSAHRENAAAG